MPKQRVGRLLGRNKFNGLLLWLDAYLLDNPDARSTLKAEPWQQHANKLADQCRARQNGLKIKTLFKTPDP